MDSRFTLPETLAPRVWAANGQPMRRRADHVLVWVQQTLRAEHNPLIDAAIHLGNARRLPVLVYHGLWENYPHASRRLHGFILRASAEMVSGLAARGVRAVVHVDRDAAREPGLLYRLARHAACVLTDDNHAFILRGQTERFARRIDCPVLLVDTARHVPTRCLPPEPLCTRAFRAAHSTLRSAQTLSGEPAVPALAPYDGDLPFTPVSLDAGDATGWADVWASLHIDHALPESVQHPPTQAEVQWRLAHLSTAVLERYARDRNNPAIPFGTSMLSPYLHFGLLGAQQLVAAVQNSGCPERLSWKFLDELLTWREWAHHCAWRTPHMHDYASLSPLTREALAARRHDPRPDEQTLDALVHGETGDRIWDAAQRQWLATGWMHNNLRMYWATQLLRFTATPERAWAIGCWLNDRCALDGRDPATYTSLRWAIGETAAAGKRPIYGKAPRKFGRALMAREGVPEWVDAAAQAPVPRLAVPQWDAVLALYAPGADGPAPMRPPTEPAL